MTVKDHIGLLNTLNQIHDCQGQYWLIESLNQIHDWQGTYWLTEYLTKFMSVKDHNLLVY